MSNLRQSSRNALRYPGGWMITNGLLPEGVASLYSLVSDAAQRAGEHDQAIAWATHALEWAKKAIEIGHVPEGQAFSVKAYLNLNQRDKAEALIKEAMSTGDANTVKLREILTQLGITWK